MSVKKGISAISDEVVSDAQRQAEATILSAEKQAKEMLHSAKLEADQKYRDLVDNAKAKAEAERRKISSVTEVEMRNRLLATKEELVNAVFEAAITQFRDFVETDQYKTYLLRLIGDIAKKMGKRDLVVEVNSVDALWLTKDKLQSLAYELQIELDIVKSKEPFIGGFIMQTRDGKIIYNSTLDSRLEELKPTLRVKIAKILFGEE